MAVDDKEYITKEYAWNMILNKFGILKLPAGEYSTYTEIETALTNLGYDINNFAFSMSEAKIGNTNKRNTDFAVVRKTSANAERDYFYQFVVNETDFSFRETSTGRNMYNNPGYSNKRIDHTTPGIGAANQKVVLTSNGEGGVLVSFKNIPGNRIHWGGGVYEYDTQLETAIFYLTKTGWIDGTINTYSSMTTELTRQGKDITSFLFRIKEVSTGLYVGTQKVSTGGSNGILLQDITKANTFAFEDRLDDNLYIKALTSFSNWLNRWISGTNRPLTSGTGDDTQFQLVLIFSNGKFKFTFKNDTNNYMYMSPVATNRWVWGNANDNFATATEFEIEEV